MGNQALLSVGGLALIISAFNYKYQFFENSREKTFCSFLFWILEAKQFIAIKNIRSYMKRN
jgi:hypothetical protein